MEQKIKARIVLAHADAKTDNSKKALPNELILYDFNKKIGNTDRTEIRLRIGDGTTSISGLPDLVLDNMNFYDSEPEKPELGDVWYNETEETFYLGTGIKGKEKIKLSHVIENIEDGLGNKSIQTTDSSTAYNNYGAALGYGSVSGAKAFSFNLGHDEYTDEDIQKKRYYLNSVANIEAGDEFSIILNNNYDYHGKIISIDTTNNYITVDNYIEPKDNDKISSNSYLLIPSKPEAGDKIIGTGATATGYSTKALGAGAHSEGYNATAAGKYSHTEGRDTKAGYAGHAEGSGTAAKFSAHAEGGSTTAQGEYSHAEGLSTTANGHSSHAEGQNTVSSETASHAEGYSTKANGKYSHAEGVSTIANEMAAHAEGNTTEANGKFSHAEGSATKANGENSHAEGTTTNASGINSHAEGNGTTASGNAAHTEGQGTIASGDQAHAEGYNSQASYQAAHAEGYVTTATKIGAHAEGSSTEATGDGAHAEGYDTIASGPYSHAEGSGTTAVSFVTHAEGQGTIARGNAQHVQGKYNIDDTNKKYAHIVGNGTSEQRSNAHTLDWEGNAWYAGGIEAKQGIFKSTEGTVNLTNGYITASNNIQAGKEIRSTEVVSEEIYNTETIYTKKINVDSEIDARNARIYANDIDVGNAGIGEAGNVYGSSLSIKDNNNNNMAFINNEGNGHFNSVTIGADKSFAIRYRGQVKTTSDLEGENREGDFVSTTINPNLPETFLGFYVSGDEPFTGDIKLTENGIEFYEVNNIFRKLLLYLTNTHLEYVNDIPEGTNDISNYSLNGPNFSRLILTFSFDTGRVLQLDLATILSQNKDKGPYTWFAGEWLSPIDDIYANFKENNLNVLMYAIPNEEDIDLTENPELEKYKKLSRSQENLYIYLNKKWVKLTNQTAFNGGSSIGKLPIIGYEDFCKYQINDENDILTCLNQAISENKTVYIMPGHYNSDEYWSIPDIDDLHFIGIGKVTLDFKLFPKGTEFYNETIQQSWIWENIIFNKEVTLSVLSLSGNTNYQRSAKVLNCQFNNKVNVCDDHGTQNYFENCIFNDNINNSENYASDYGDLDIEYINCIFNINKWSTDINKILASKIEYCTFYFPIEQKNIVFGRAFTNNGGFNSSNLFTNNIYYLMGVETRFLTPNIWVENLSVKHSSFPWKPILEPINENEEGLVCKIDRDTCYINNNSSDNEVLIQNKNKDFIQNASSLDKVVIEGVKKTEAFPTTVALVSGTENTPDGNRFDRYKLWKENKNFSYLEQITGGFIQGSNHFILGPNFVTGSGHLATGVLHTIEGAGNIIGGVEGGLSDMKLRADHAEGMSNILPSEYGEPQSRFPMARHIEGFGNIGNSVAGSHVQGYYCLKDENNEYIHIVGNGEDDENRSNAHTIDKEGNAWFAGGLTFGKDNRPALTYNNEGHEQFPYPQINGTMFVLNQDIIEKDNNSVDFTDSIYTDRIEEDEHGLWKIVLNKESKLYDILTVAINKIQGVSYEDIPLGMIFNPLDLKLELKNVSNEAENPNILDFSNLQSIDYYSDEEVALYFDSITTKLSLEYEQEAELNPDTGEEEIIRKFYAFNSGVNKKVIIEGFYNYNTNDKYEKGLYICTDNGWEKLIIGVDNSSNANTPIISTLQSGPIILPIPSNAEKVDNQYKFIVDLSKYGIKKGQTINVACVGAGGGGAGYSTAKAGGKAGQSGFSSGSKSGGRAGTGYGAGGGGCYATGSSYYSTGGGSGYVTMSSIIVEETRVEALVGIGGAGGTGTTTAKREGKPGGSTEFLGLKADGGLGGTYSTDKTSGGMGGNQGSIGVKGNAGGNGGNGWIPSNYDPESKTIQMYGVTSNDNVPTYSGDGAIFIWY